MDRHYSVAIQPTLLDDVAVVCVWDSRRINCQHVQLCLAGSWEEAEAVAEKIVRGSCGGGIGRASEGAAVGYAGPSLW